MDVTTTVGCEMNMPHVFTIDQSNDLKSGLTTAEFSVSFPTKGWLSLSAKCCRAVGWGYWLALSAGTIGWRYRLALLAGAIGWRYQLALLAGAIDWHY